MKCTKYRKCISATEKENHIRWRNRAWVCCVFFTETKQIVLFAKQNNLFGFCEKNTANPISGKNGFGFVVYGFVVFGLWEKCRGCGFLWMGCLAKRLGRKRARRAHSASEKNGDSLL
jgi:hypothetical protein